MATLEQTLQLHDEFSNKLTKINDAAQETLTTFEKMDAAMNQEVKLTGTEALEQQLSASVDQTSKLTQGIETLQGSIQTLSENSSNRPLVDSQPTVEELNTVEQATNRTSGVFDKLRDRMDSVRGNAVREPLVVADATVNEVYELTDAVSRAKQQLDLLREQRQIQQREVRMLEAELTKLNENEAGAQAINKMEKALNTANRQLFRHTDAVNKARDTHSELVYELEHVSSAMDRVGEGRLSGFVNTIQNSITWIQTLIDKVKEVAIHAPREAVMNGFNRGVEGARQRITGLWNHLRSLDGSTVGGQAMLPLNRGIDSAVERVGRLRERFATLRGQIEQSRFGQSRFGQEIMKSDQHAKQFMSGLRKGGSDFLNITRNIIGVSARLPFAWMKLVPIIGRMINRQRESKQLVDQTSNSTSKLGRVVQMVKFGAWVIALRKVYQMIDNVANKLDEFTNIQTRLDVILDITASDTSLKEMNQQIIASSLDARSAFQDTADFVARVGKTTNVFGDPREIVGFSNLLQKSMRASGTSGEKMQSAMEQVALAMQRGKIEGRELRTLMQDAPLVVKSIADHFNMTTQELTEMAGEGIITADAIKNAMFASADEIQARFDEIPYTWADHWNGVRNVAAYAIEPLRQAFNDFMNSDVTFTLFEALTTGFVFVANVALVVFDVISAGLTWVAENIDKITLGLSLLGAVLLAVGIAGLVIWAALNWKILLIGMVIFWVIDVLHGLGLTADQVVGFMAGAIMFLGSLIYNVILGVIGVFHAMFQFIFNQFVGFYNNVISIAEFFLNVWNNPVYSVQMLFYNMVKTILGFIASIVDGAGSAGDALGSAFINGVNIAVRAVNWLINLINKIPGFNIGTMGEFATSSGGGGSAGDAVRNMAERFNPGDAPDNYKSLGGMKLDMTPVDGLTNAIGSMVSPMDNYHKGYEFGSNLVTGASDFMSNMGDMVSRENAMLGSMVDQMGQAAKGIDPTGGKGLGDKVGKGKEVGDVGKIKSDVTISDEDLKYLRDVAERNYIIRLQQVSPNATINYTGSGDTEEDAKKLLEKMEDMIVEQVATNLL